MTKLKKIKKISPAHAAMISCFKFNRQFGIGARYGSEWMVSEFLDNEVACIGYDKEETPEIFSQFKTLKKGDIIFMKAFGPSSTQLCIMGIGIVTGNKVYHVSDELGWGINVKWVFGHGDNDEIYLLDKLGQDKHRNVRIGTLYEEFHPQIKRQIASILAESIVR